MSFTMPYSELYILIELSANDVKFISVDRLKLDLLKYIHVWYRKFYICKKQSDSTSIKMTHLAFALAYTEVKKGHNSI